jgi:beta-lactamase regulating signal transducer with metallopeptidase domain
MIFDWMAYAILCAALCAVVGVCADVALRVRLRQRRAIWIAAMLASVALPLVMPLLLPTTEAVPLAQATAAAAEESGRARSVLYSPKPGVDWGQLALMLWVTTSALLGSALIISGTQLRRRLQGYRRTRIDGQTLLVSDDFGPAVVGLLHPTIVLPAWALRLTESERRLVVSHELEHQRARDPVVTIGALLVVALFPWNVALWWQLSRLRLAIEFDCDARVVARSGADPFAYGNLLLTAHENTGQTRLAVLALAPLRSALGQRINALVVRSAQSRRRTLGAVGLAVLALSAVGFAPVPKAPRTALALITSSTHVRANAPEAASPTALRLTEAPTAPSVADAPSMTSPARAPGVKEPRRAARPTSPDSALIPTLTRMPGADSVRTIPPESNPYATPTHGGSFGAVAAAVMRRRDDTSSRPDGGVGGVVQRAPTGGAMLSSGGERGGQLSGDPPLKRYTGGFMNAEVPARPDSARPPIR